VRGEMQERLTAAPRLRRMATDLDSAMSRIEREVYQVKNQSGQDPLNYPVRLKTASPGSPGWPPPGPTVRRRRRSRC